MLEHLGYISADELLTDKGENLSNIYAECDLLLAECLSLGVLENLTTNELAAVLSVFIYESRNSSDEKTFTLPTRNTKQAVIRVENILASIRELEGSRNIQLTRSIDAGFANAIHDWLIKERLDVILLDSDLVPGDFVRWVKQLIDLCNQISNCNIPDSLRKQVKEVKKAATYGIVSASDSLALQIE
jgi:ATP-dependent RNA helicase HelY